MTWKPQIYCDYQRCLLKHRLLVIFLFHNFSLVFISRTFLWLFFSLVAVHYSRRWKHVSFCRYASVFWAGLWSVLPSSRRHHLLGNDLHPQCSWPAISSSLNGSPHRSVLSQGLLITIFYRIKEQAFIWTQAIFQ